MSTPHVARPDGVPKLTVDRDVLRRVNGARRRSRTAGPAGANAVGFLVLGGGGVANGGVNASPTCEMLLRGIAAACLANRLRLDIGFVTDAADAPDWLFARQVDGLLLHGEQLPTGMSHDDRLRALPSVWLMASRRRPAWGDQVMPNNAVVGDIAAKYLVRRGHRTLAHLCASGDTWCLRLQAFGFQHAAQDAGAQAIVIEAPPLDTAGAGEHLRAALLAGGKPRATGLFVPDDRLLAPVDRALRGAGLRVGPGGDVEIVACRGNPERPSHPAGLPPPPPPSAAVDVRAEAIGSHGVEQLIWRMRNADVRERVRTMIEPAVVEPSPAAPRRAVQTRATGAADADGVIRRRRRRRRRRSSRRHPKD